MATSGSIDYIVDRDDIITEALVVCGVIAEGETPSTETLASAGRTLNMLVKSWQAAGLNLFAITNQTVDLVADTASYTLSPRPFQILYAIRRDSDGNDSVLDVEPLDEYAKLSDKDKTGVPTMVYYDPQVGTGNKLYVWPVQDDTEYDIIVYYARTLEDFDAATDDADYPQEWYLPLALNLAVLLSPKYGIPDEQYRRILGQATYWKEMAEGFDRPEYVRFGVDTHG